jgi:hypothetical protein
LSIRPGDRLTSSPMQGKAEYHGDLTERLVHIPSCVGIPLGVYSTNLLSPPFEKRTAGPDLDLAKITEDLS